MSNLDSAAVAPIFAGADSVMYTKFNTWYTWHEGFATMSLQIPKGIMALGAELVLSVEDEILVQGSWGETLDTRFNKAGFRTCKEDLEWYIRDFTMKY